MIRKFFDQLKKYLEVSNFERLGFFTLIFVVSLVCAYQFYIHNYFQKNAITEDPQVLNDFIAKNEKLLKDTIQNKNFQNYTTNKLRVSELFNPNTDTKEQLIQKGLSSRIVKNILNYRNKGGTFRVKKDLVRLYSLSESEYNKLRPFVALPDTLTKNYNNPVFKSKPKNLVIQINTCSADSLENLRGIGPVFAKRIVAFRSKLGGFYSLDQLNEVYGLSTETIEIIMPHLILYTTKIKKIKLNTMDIEGLSSHPYLSYNEAKAVINYREQHGHYTKLSTVKSLHIFRNKSIHRLLPYLDLN